MWQEGDVLLVLPERLGEMSFVGRVVVLPDGEWPVVKDWFGQHWQIRPDICAQVDKRLYGSPNFIGTQGSC